MNPSTITTRDPRTLRPHRLHKQHVPPPDKKSAEWIAFLETVRADGRIRTAVSITRDGLVTDGWWRREAAVDLQLDSIPVEIVEDSEAALLIVETLTARKQMTRGAAVYLALGLLPDYIHAAEARRLRNITAKRTTAEQPLSSTRHPNSTRYLAERWGCNHNTIAQAQIVRETFYDLKTFTTWLKANSFNTEGDPAEFQEAIRAEFEPLLYNGTRSLWTILQALAGRLATKGKAKTNPRQLELFQGGIYTFIQRSGQIPDLNLVRPMIEAAIGNICSGDQLHRVCAIVTELQRQAAARLHDLKKQTTAKN